MLSAPLYIFSICLPFATILVVFGMRYVSAVLQARARLANDDAYRLVAEKAATAETDTLVALSSIQAALGDVRIRLTAVEKILKEVE